MYTVLYLQPHKELVAKTRTLLLDELNALTASDTTPLSDDWRAIIFCYLQCLCSDLVRAFGGAAHHDDMGMAECVDPLAVWRMGRQLAQRILYSMTAALAID